MTTPAPRSHRWLSFPVLLVLLPACAAQVLIPAEERLNLERQLTGKDRDRFVRLSFYVTPFFGDSSKRLLTPVPPNEVRMLEEPGGATVSPGAIEAIVPAGKHARIAKVEFATAYAIAERVPYTPRTQPWVYLEVEGQPKDRPLILVLRQQLKSSAEFLAEVDRYLSQEDPAPVLAGFSEPVQQAIKEKSALMDMPADALEFAWGYPERKKVRFEEAQKVEEWHYADDRRVATLTDGRVSNFIGGGAR